MYDSVVLEDGAYLNVQIVVFAVGYQIVYKQHLLNITCSSLFMVAHLVIFFVTEPKLYIALCMYIVRV